MVQKRHTRSEEWIDDAPDEPWDPGLHVRDGRGVLIEATGLLSAAGRPIIRVYRPSNPIGFLADLDEDADGEGYDYAEVPGVPDED